MYITILNQLRPYYTLRVAVGVTIDGYGLTNQKAACRLIGRFATVNRNLNLNRVRNP